MEVHGRIDYLPTGLLASLPRNRGQLAFGGRFVGDRGVIHSDRMQGKDWIEGRLVTEQLGLKMFCLIASGLTCRCLVCCSRAQAVYGQVGVYSSSKPVEYAAENVEVQGKIKGRQGQTRWDMTGTNAGSWVKRSIPRHTCCRSQNWEHAKGA